MYTAPAGLELRPLVLPATIEAADAADFVEMVRVRNEVYAEINGHDDESVAAAELLSILQRQEYEQRLIWIAILDGEVVGRLGVDLPLENGSRVAFWRIELLRRAWSRGIGTAAYELIERSARAHGRTVLQSWAAHPDAAGERMEPPTGFGSIPVDHAVRFYLARGYTLEQIERNSAFELSRTNLDRAADLLTIARRAATDYRIVQWEIPTPAEYVEGYAWMKSRMVTDAPAAAMEFDDEVWDADRLTQHERPYLESGRTLQVTSAVHIPTGELAAFNELCIGADKTEATSQEDTLVLQEHRGHRLGMLVKCAGLVSWHHVAPGSPRVLTYNAEENRPMLDINEEIGFVPIAYSGAWKKVLS